MNKKGFTLIELLIVIIIVGTLSTILVPSLVNIIKKSRYKTFKESAKSVIRAADDYFADKIYDVDEGSCFDINDGKIDLKVDSSVKNGQFCVINSQPYLKQISDGKLCASGNNDNIDIYKCGEKSVVLFSGRYLEKNNNPYIKIPDFAFVVKNGDTLSKYISDYSKTYPGSVNSYNFWDSYNLSSIPLHWDTEFNDDTVINSDTVYSVNAIKYINGVETNISNGNYNIIFQKNQLMNIGYDNDIIGENVSQSNTLKDWTLQNDGSDNYSIINSSGIYINYNLSAIGTKLMLNNTQTKFKLQLLDDGSFNIHPIDNTDYCIGTVKKSFESNNFLEIESCNANDISQKFLFKKVS